MRNREVAEAFLAAINRVDFDAAAPYCAENFTYSGSLDKPVSLEEWRRVAMPFLAAFPDWQFNARVEREAGDMMHLTCQVTGTHTGDWELSVLGLGVIPATGKAFSLPRTPGRLTLESGKVVNLHWGESEDEVEVHGSGIRGILAQLGVATR
jgi:hypothetical protein